MLGRIAGSLFALGMALLLSGVSQAEERLALVIGNDAYAEVAPLERAVADARAYRDLLQDKRGFRVFYSENAGRREMNTRVAEFLSAITPGDTAMVVYSGHGVQLNDDHRDSLYLLPIDFPNRDPGQGAERHFFDAESLNFSRLARDVADRGAKLRLFVLDACRNNPFSRASGGTRAIGMSRGIGRINSTSGEFVIYAAAPGEVAYDSLPGEAEDSRNSVFTRAFIKHFQEGVYLEDVANDVQAEVVRLARAANVNQEPYYSDGVAGRTCLDDNCGRTSGPTVDLGVGDKAREELFWGFCERKSEPAYCRTYLSEFPESWRAPLARARLIELTGEPSAATVKGSEGRDPSDDPADIARLDDRPKPGDGGRAAIDANGDEDPAPSLPATGAAKMDTNDSFRTGVETPPDADAAKMEERLVRTDPAAEAARPGEDMKISRHEIRLLQAGLSLLGLEPGPLDGLMGGRTRTAIRKFQADAGMPVDGLVSSRLLMLVGMKAGPSKVQALIAREDAEATARREASRRSAARREAARQEALRARNAASARATSGTTASDVVDPPETGAVYDAGSTATRSTTGTTESGSTLRTRDGTAVKSSSGTAIRTGTDDAEARRRAWECRNHPHLAQQGGRNC